MIQVQVVSTCALESRPCIVVSGESKRIIVNVGEGLQRLAIEQRLRLARLESVCLTEVNSLTAGGLIGMALTANDAGLRELTMHGPAGLTSLWKSTKSFMLLPQFRNNIVDYSASPEWSSHPPNADGIATHVLPLTPHSLCFLFSTSPSPGKFDISKAQALGIPRGRHYATLKSGQAVVLEDGRCIQPHEVVAPTIPSCFVLVVPALVSTSAEDVTVLTKNMWFKRFSSGGDLEGSLTVVYHFSSAAVVSSGAYTQWVVSLGEDVDHVYLGRGACLTNTSFNASTAQTRKLNTLCPQLFPDLLCHWGLPVLNYSAVHFQGATPASPPARVVPGHAGMVYTLLPVRNRGFHPDTPTPENYTLAASATLDGGRDAFIRDCMQTPELALELSQLHEAQLPYMPHLSSMAGMQSVPQRAVALDPKMDAADLADTHLLFLGTGCAVPSKYRNVSGMYLHMLRGAILLDPGEGSWSQLLRIVHAPEVAERLGLNVCLASPSSSSSSSASSRDRDASAVMIQQALAAHLKVMWISHPHADHHLGCLRVFEERCTLLGDAAYSFPLLVIAPATVLSFIEDYVKTHTHLTGSFIAMSTRLFDPSDDLKKGDDGWAGVDPTGYKRGVAGDGNSQQMAADSILHGFGIHRLRSVRVKHVIQSYGIVIEAQTGWKLVYSGDTRPSSRLEEMGKDALVLVHEATFEDGAEKEARARAHSTISEALRVGRNMKAYRTVLTHFSQRYPGTPHLPMTSPDMSTAVVAFDYMHLCLAHLPWAPALVPVLLRAFPPPEAGADLNDGDGDEVASGPVCNCVALGAVAAACASTLEATQAQAQQTLCMVCMEPGDARGGRGSLPLPPQKRSRMGVMSDLN
jgi:ribonuclease Z